MVLMNLFAEKEWNHGCREWDLGTQWGWVRVGRKSYWFMETKPVGVWGGNPLAGRPLRRAPEPG